MNKYLNKDNSSEMNLLSLNSNEGKIILKSLVLLFKKEMHAVNAFRENFSNDSVIEISTINFKVWLNAYHPAFKTHMIKAEGAYLDGMVENIIADINK